MKNTTFNAITKEESEVKKQYDIMPKFQLSPSTKHLVLQIKNSPNYSREEEYALFEAYKAGDQEAYDSLLIYGTKFVMYHAKRLSTNEQGFEDYVSAGYKGLHDAIVNFDISKGFRLCTYANSKIVKEINLYISQNFRQITVPKNLNESFSTINRIAREKGIKLFTDEEKEVIIDEMVERVRNKLKKSDSAKQRAKYQKQLSDMPKLRSDTLDIIIKYLNLPYEMSFNTPTGDDEDCEFGDVVGDKKAEFTRQIALSEELEQLFSNVSETQQYIFYMKEVDGNSYKEIASELGMKVDQVKYQYNSEKKKLQQSSYDR